MTKEQLDALRATMPWREHLTTPPGMRGGLVQIVDRYNREVPLFVLTKFVVHISNRMTATPTATGIPPETQA